jgi:hypothetical protein
MRRQKRLGSATCTRDWQERGGAGSEAEADLGAGENAGGAAVMRGWVWSRQTNLANTHPLCAACLDLCSLCTARVWMLGSFVSVLCVWPTCRGVTKTVNMPQCTIPHRILLRWVHHPSAYRTQNWSFRVHSSRTLCWRLFNQTDLRAPFPASLELGRGQVQSKLCQFLVGVQIEITELKIQSSEVSTSGAVIGGEQAWGAAPAPSHARWPLRPQPWPGFRIPNADSAAAAGAF